MTTMKLFNVTDDWCLAAADREANCGAPSTGTTMKLVLSATPYSSVVGGGLSLREHGGRVRFMVMLCGTTEGITKAEDAAIVKAIMDALPNGIEVPDREGGE